VVSNTGRTWRRTLQDLSGRLKRGAYRGGRSRFVRRTSRKRTGGRAARRSHAGRTRSSSAPSSRCSTPSTKRTSSGFSYGFRPGRSPHQALDALAVGIEARRVNWVLDADIRSFFDPLDHDGCEVRQSTAWRTGAFVRLHPELVERRRAGGREADAVEVGTVQGGVSVRCWEHLSPLLCSTSGPPVEEKAGTGNVVVPCALPTTSWWDRASVRRRASCLAEALAEAEGVSVWNASRQDPA